MVGLLDLMFETRKLPRVKASHLAGWTPVRLKSGRRGMRVVWLDLRGVPFNDPFFEETLIRSVEARVGRLRVAETPLKALGEVGRLAPTLRPSGFIFHMSRCGSTLVANYLDVLPGSVVLREPLQFETLLGSDDLSDAEKVRELPNLVAALGQRHGGRKRLFIKFGAISVVRMSLLLEAFPDVPWIFIYRNPVEVMSSNFTKGQTGWIWDDRVNGLSWQEIGSVSWAEACARSLARLCEAAIRQAGPKGLFIDYERIDAREILRHFGIVPTAAELRRIARKDGNYAKASVGERRKFVPDSRQKRKLAPPVLHRVAKRRLAGVHRKLARLSSR